MGRSRSRSISPVVRRRRGKEDRSKRKRRSKSREKRRRSRSNSRDDRRRTRSRSRSYERRHRSRSPYSSKSKIQPVHNVSASDLEGKSPEEIEMMKVMGFCGFDTTKGKKVDGNNVGEVHVILKRKYRQYMNRKGGFNRPLDFVA